MKKILTLILACLLVGCETTVPQTPSPETKLKNDLIGHVTGGREKSWLFREGQIKRVKILSSTEDRIEAALLLQSLETREWYFVIVRVDYFFCLTHCHGQIETVGLIYIEKIDP